MTRAIDTLLKKHEVLLKDEPGTMKTYRYIYVLSQMQSLNSLGQDLLRMLYNLSLIIPLFLFLNPSMVRECGNFKGTVILCYILINIRYLKLKIYL